MQFKLIRCLTGSSCFLLLAAQLGTQPAPAATAHARMYPVPAGSESMRATDVQVRVGGAESFVYALLKRGVIWTKVPTVPTEFTSFELGATPVRVAVQFRGVAVHSARILPLSLGIKPTVRSGRVTFSVAKPGVYEVEVNGGIEDRPPVLVIANAAQAAPADPGDGSLTVYRGGQIYDAGLIHVTKPNSRIFIEGGAIVRAGIFVDSASGVEVEGPGILLYDDKTEALQAAASRTARRLEILAFRADGFRLNGPTIVVAPTSFSSPRGPVAPWAVHIAQSSGVAVTNTKILNELRDGIDVDGSDTVDIGHTFVQSADDAISLKSTNYGPGGGGRSVFDVNVHDSTLATVGGGKVFSIGFELHAPEVRDVTFQDIEVPHALAYAHSSIIDIEDGDRAIVRNITFQYIRVDERHPATILRVRILKDPVLPDETRGSVAHIMVNDVVVNGRGPSEIEDFDDEHSISDVTLQAVRIDGQAIRTQDDLNLRLKSSAKLNVR